MDIKKLPPAFLARVKAQLKDAYPAFLQSYEEESARGLRVNTLKLSPETFEKSSPFALRAIPWIPGGYSIRQEDGAGRHPFYYAGLYYLQEPSAMTPATVLDVAPGDRVLDLCAAPGGKSTALGAKLKGEGVLVSNDISASRCRALQRNVELFGIPNAVITNEVPAVLSGRFPGYFDRVLVDAPCSGEGMFRKEEAVARAWDPEKPAACAKIQKEIILRAADMLREGGRLLYSTCTFSEEENEQVIEHLLRERPEMRLLPISLGDGSNPLRIWPHEGRGEGHFLALLQKGEVGAPGCFKETVGPECEMPTGRQRGISTGRQSEKLQDRPYETKHGRQRGVKTRGNDRQSGGSKELQAAAALFETFCAENKIVVPGYRREKLFTRDTRLFMAAMPEEELAGIHYFRNGLLLGEVKKDRFEPAQALAMALTGIDPKVCFDLRPEDERVMRYLKGETINLSDDEVSTNGWKLVTVSGHALGWGKLTGPVLKNKYPAGWRLS